MKLIALMVVRNEDWVLELSAAAALLWCDGLVVLDHGSTDRTPSILDGIELFAMDAGKAFRRLRSDDIEVWNEMAHRQTTLEAGRALGGSHFAIIDADEVLTANLLPRIRGDVEALPRGALLNVPMVPCWRSLDAYREDDSVWAHSVIAVAFHDDPNRLRWHAAGDGYEHHHRPPHGIGTVVKAVSKGAGGVFHLQFANWDRLVAKHAWYKMMEVTRWPSRRPALAVDALYSQAVSDPRPKTLPVPPEWWARYGDLRGGVQLAGESWHVAECKRLWDKHGPEAFAWLDLYGVVG